MVFARYLPLNAKASNRSSSWDKISLISLFIVAVLGFVTRFYNIWYPGVVLFDEVHFVSMTQWYLARKYFFDIHPPLGKLLLAFVGFLFNFNDFESYRDIGKTYETNSYIYLRCFQALWGALLPVVCFMSMKLLKFSTISCIFSSLLIILELSLQTISRAILLDSLLYFCIASAFFSALKMWDSLDRYYSKIIKYEARESDFFKRNKSKMLPLVIQYWLWVLMCGCFQAFALSIKHTGLGIVGVIGVIQIYRCFYPFYRVLFYYQPSFEKSTNREFDLIPSWWKKTLYSFFIMISIVIFVYIFCFYIHFTVCFAPLLCFPMQLSDKVVQGY